MCLFLEACYRYARYAKLKWDVADFAGKTGGILRKEQGEGRERRMGNLSQRKAARIQALTGVVHEA